MNMTIILTTVDDFEKACQLAKKILNNRLAACISIIPCIKSMYWWKNKLEEAEEHLLIIKTSERQREALMKFIEENHPYEVPEIVEVKTGNVFEKYLQWVIEETSK